MSQNTLSDKCFIRCGSTIQRYMLQGFEDHSGFLGLGILVEDELVYVPWCKVCSCQMCSRTATVDPEGKSGLEEMKQAANTGKDASIQTRRVRTRALVLTASLVRAR